MDANKKSNLIVAGVVGVLAVVILVIFVFASSGGGGGGGGGGVPTQGTGAENPGSNGAISSESEGAGQVPNNTSIPYASNPTAEETAKITEESNAAIQTDYPEYSGVTPVVSASEINGMRTVYASYTLETALPGSAATMKEILVFSMNQDGVVIVGQNG